MPSLAHRASIFGINGLVVKHAALARLALVLVSISIRTFTFVSWGPPAAHAYLQCIFPNGGEVHKHNDLACTSHSIYKIDSFVACHFQPAGEFAYCLLAATEYWVTTADASFESVAIAIQDNSRQNGGQGSPGRIDGLFFSGLSRRRYCRRLVHMFYLYTPCRMHLSLQTMHLSWMVLRLGCLDSSELCLVNFYTSSAQMNKCSLKSHHFQALRTRTPKWIAKVVRL